uniref:Uncharacterized protein n=1 Tax=Steinernema glaseri TaxID=37863 RepID=A0A1I7YTS9_9BILA
MGSDRYLYSVQLSSVRLGVGVVSRFGNKSALHVAPGSAVTDPTGHGGFHEAIKRRLRKSVQRDAVSPAADKASPKAYVEGLRRRSVRERPFLHMGFTETASAGANSYQARVRHMETRSSLVLLGTMLLEISQWSVKAEQKHVRAVFFHTHKHIKLTAISSDHMSLELSRE